MLAEKVLAKLPKQAQPAAATVPAAAGRTYILAGGEVTTLNELVALTADIAKVAPPSPVWTGA